VTHGFVLLQCSQTAATICKAHLHSLLSGLPNLKYFIFVLTGGPVDTYIVSKISLLKMCFIYARIYENGPSGNTPTFIRSGAEVITFWPVAIFMIVSLFLETYEQTKWKYHSLGLSVEVNILSENGGVPCIRLIGAIMVLFVPLMHM